MSVFKNCGTRHPPYSTMPPSKGPLWKFYYQGEKQNSSQFKAYCKGCIQHHCIEDEPIDVDNPDMEAEVDLTQGWYKMGELHLVTCSLNAN
jgi:hypothetical protein